MSRAPPKRASATSPPRPAMVGTVLPQDSLRGLRGAAPPPWADTTVRHAPLPPPPPSVASSAASSIAHAQNLRLLARAGRDLFRQGLAIDGVRAPRAEPRHPAVTPNLRSIPEDGAVSAAATAPSELVVIVGGPLNARGEPGLWVSSRVAKAIQLYWQTMLAFAREDAEEEDEEDEEEADSKARGALCFLVPTGGEASDEGELETEAIRRALVGTGISPHHILMDCSATSLVDNALRLAGVLRRRRVRRVHVVTSAFHVARARLCFDEVLRAALGDDLGGAKLEFHGAPDGIKAADRAARHADEQARMRAARAEIDAALQTLRADAKSRARHQQQQHQLAASVPRRASSYASDV